MMSFRQFCDSKMNEGVLGKAAVAGYALQGKRHGDAAVRSFQSARSELQQLRIDKKADETSKRLASAAASTADGLISLRQQIGSLSAQITSVSLL